MSAHVLWNLLKELWKRDTVRAIPCVLFLFHNEFDKFSTTGARMLDSIHRMPLKLLKIAF